MIEWQSMIAIFALAIAGLTLFQRVIGGSLTRLEHEEFKRRVESDLEKLTRGQEARLVIREYEADQHAIRIDLQRLENNISVLDHTKPTTGELDRASKSLEGRIAALEDRIKALNDRIFSTISANGNGHKKPA